MIMPLNIVDVKRNNVKYFIIKLLIAYLLEIGKVQYSSCGIISFTYAAELTLQMLSPLYLFIAALPFYVIDKDD